MLRNTSDEGFYGDLLLGGYAEKGFRADNSINCNPNSSQDKSEGHGYVKYLRIKDNTFNSLSSEEESITLQYRTTHAIILQEGVEAVNESGNGSARGDANAVRVEE